MTDNKYLSFEPDTAEGKILYDWWQGLDKNRGERARLRRCKNPLEVASVQVFFNPLFKLEREGKVSSERLALVIGALSHVKTYQGGKPFPELMAEPKTEGGSNYRVSELRFRRLLEIKDRDELYPAIIRMIKMVDSKANIYGLANDLYWWNERTKKEWAYRYFGKVEKFKSN
jgi:CRISPR system Cascade subunit CasB